MKNNKNPGRGQNQDKKKNMGEGARNEAMGESMSEDTEMGERQHGRVNASRQQGSDTSTETDVGDRDLDTVGASQDETVMAGDEMADEDTVTRS